MPGPEKGVPDCVGPFLRPPGRYRRRALLPLGPRRLGADSRPFVEWYELPVAVPVQAPVMAPLWKRGMAGALDSLPFIVLAVAVPQRDPRGRRPRRGLRLAAIALSGAYHISLTAKRGQTLGQMVLGIRVVDAKTTALPTPKQSALRWAVATIPDAFAQLVPLSERVETTLAVITDLQPEMDRLTQLHEGDRERLNEELMGLFKEVDWNPIGVCLPIVLRALPSLAMSCALYAPLLQGSRQALHDRLAGTVVIEAPKRLDMA